MFSASAFTCKITFIASSMIIYVISDCKENQMHNHLDQKQNSFINSN